MVIFGAAAGLRPAELFGLEQHDVGREAGVVYVRRAFANGQAKALEALDRLPASVNPILFPNVRGGRVDFRVSAAATGDPRRSPLVSNRSVGSTTYATPTPHSRSALVFRSSPSHVSSARASR